MAALGNLESAVGERLRAMAADAVVERIWSKDPTVWGGTRDTPELLNRLGWLSVADRVLAADPAPVELAEGVRAECDLVVLCGMGGSSLAADVFWSVFGPRSGFPPLAMLDSTAPNAVRTILGGASKPLFVISSKSGSTLETASFLSHFWQLARADGSRFIAITDEGSRLYRQATEKGFRAVVQGDPDVGGRFSALSPFGIVPAALTGSDVNAVIAGARSAMEACRHPASVENPGAWLGAVLGEAAVAGRDKLTLLLSPELSSFGGWVEQLVAESTGKQGKGLLPVIDDGAADLGSFGADRLFVSLEIGGRVDEAVDVRMNALAKRGHPVVGLALGSRNDLGAEFFRWEFATAVAAAVIGVNPFDQPDVGESKARTARVLESQTKPRAIPEPDPVDFAAWISLVAPGDYLAILVYTAPTAETDRLLGGIARSLQERLNIAVTVGYGPRYLHSTGQYHKGGPARGHFIQVVELPEDDLPVPGGEHSFGEIARAQAEGDASALGTRERPVFRLPSVRALHQLLA
ncbi:MAG: glucose-6-phosphate isomerase [Gemmatimonadetes bacterium]|nr:glucose-6-phosphate isomerase [Gemmatimonadota bacterium]